MQGRAHASTRAEGLVFDLFVSNTHSSNHSEEYPLEQLAVSTLVVNARDDPAANYDDARAMSERIPGARLLTIERGGHLMLGSGDLVRAEIDRFLRQHASGPPARPIGPTTGALGE